MDAELPFDAFLSYSRKVDARLAARLQSGLQRFAKPWYRFRTLRVFRDDASLSANPGLWPSIKDALDSSRFFIVLGSVDAAQSEWVDREVSYWVENRDARRLLIGLTEGTIKWDPTAGDFDWAETSALPPSVRGSFAEDPRWVDLRWARTRDDLSLRNPRFRDAVADFASTIQGKPKDELVGEEVRQHRRALRLARGGAAVLALLAAAATTLAILAIQSRDRANAQASLATSRELSVESDSSLREGRLDRALLLAAQAYATSTTGDARSVLAESLTAARHLRRMIYEGQPIVDSSASADGRRVAILRRDGSIAIWDLGAGHVVGEPLRLRRVVDALALNGDGSKLALGFGSHTSLYVWDVETRRWERPLGDPDTPGLLMIDRNFPEPVVRSVAFGGRDTAVWTGGEPAKSVVGAWRGGKEKYVVWVPAYPCEVVANVDGSRVAIVDSKTLLGTKMVTRVTVWRLGPSGLVGTKPVSEFRPRSGFAPNEIGCAQRGSVAFDPVRPMVLAVGGWDGSVSLWDVEKGRELGLPLRAKSGAVSHVAFSPDGSHLLAVDAGGTTVWNLANRSELLTPLPDSASDAGAWFLADGRTVALVGTGGAIALGDLRTRQFQLARALPAGDAMTDAFAPDGTIASGGLDGTVRLWHGSTLRPRGKRVATGFTGPELSFSHDGKRILAASLDEATVLRTDTLKTTLRATPGSNASTYRFALASDGRVLAVGGSTVLRLPRNRRPVTLRGTGLVFNVAIHADAEQVLLTTNSGTAVWDLETGKRLTRLFPGNTATWTDDGTVIATVSRDGTLSLWDATSGRRTKTLPSGAAPYELAFAADGTLLAGITTEGSKRLSATGSAVSLYGLQLWDVSRGALVGAGSFASQVQGGQGLRQSLHFSADGKQLATADGRVLVWTLDPSRWQTLACALAGRPLTKSEWAQFVGSTPYSSKCR